MLLSTSLNTRDRVVTNSLETMLKTVLRTAFSDANEVLDKDENFIFDIVKSAFESGNEAWLNRYMPQMIGEKGVEQLKGLMAHNLGSP